MGLADLGPTVRIVDFWATWCLPCHLQTDVLVKAYPELRARGVEVLAVGVGEDEKTVRAYLAKHPVPYPNLLGAQDTVLGGRLGVPLLPVILVLDRAGQVAFFDAGILDRPSLEKVLAKAGVPPAPAAGSSGNRGDLAVAPVESSNQPAAEERPAAGSPAGVSPTGRTTSTTRRLVERPSRLPLSAIGDDSPYEITDILCSGSPCFWSR